MQSRNTAVAMTPEDARELLRHATWDKDGTFVLLRLGNDPGEQRIAELRIALHALWLHWKDKGAIPSDISANAVSVLAFCDESERNLRNSGESLRPELLGRDLPRLRQSAFYLLWGPQSEQDLGRNGERWIPLDKDFSRATKS